MKVQDGLLALLKKTARELADEIEKGRSSSSQRSLARKLLMEVYLIAETRKKPDRSKIETLLRRTDFLLVELQGRDLEWLPHSLRIRNPVRIKTAGDGPIIIRIENMKRKMESFSERILGMIKKIEKEQTSQKKMIRTPTPKIEGREVLELVWGDSEL